MTLKLTRRRNGKLMTTVRVTAHLDRDDVVSAIAYHQSIWGDVGDTLTRAKIDKAIRDVIADHGANFRVPCDDSLREDEHGAELREWADRELTRLYPNWMD